MEPEERATLETWLGPIESGSGFSLEDDLSDRLERLKVPELVALEVLRADQARMIRLAASVASDDVRSQHTENLKRIGPLIDELAAAIRQDDGITLTAEGEKLVAGAEAGGSEGARIVNVTASAKRRG